MSQAFARWLAAQSPKLTLSEAALDDWRRATERLLSGLPREQAARCLLALARAHAGPELRAVPGSAELADEAERGAVALAWAELEGLDDGALADALATRTSAAVAALFALEEPERGLGRRLVTLFPELAGLLLERPTPLEHEGPGGVGRPLLGHLRDRTLRRKLAGLEAREQALFQRGDTLSPAGFTRELALLDRVAGRGLLPAVRTALLFLDFAKGGSAAARAEWEALGADLSIHNAAARRVLERQGVLRRFPRLRDRPAEAALVLWLVDAHGLTGQAVRGETPPAAFAPLLAELRAIRPALAAHLEIAEAAAARAALDALALVNTVDTAAVREGLYDDHLQAEMGEVLALLTPLAEGSGGDAALELALERADGARFARRQGLAGAELERARLGDRLLRLRRGRLERGEPEREVRELVAALAQPELELLTRVLARCQLWYAEAATAGLSAAGQLKVLALGLALARQRLDLERPFHLSLEPLLADLAADPRDRSARARQVPYRLRLTETALSRVSLADILDGDPPPMPVVGFALQLGREEAVALSFQESEEARALLTLLPIYEQKSSAAFHATLKTLCDLYGLRKDDFDRVANEAQYLVHMNGAQSDKARMLDFVRPGRVVEIGPGGGVVLALLADRFPDSEIIGVDVSRMVVQALEERKKRERARWRVVEADAFTLAETLGPRSVDSVVLCSVLHEIYSYVPYPRDGSAGAQPYRLESVLDLLRACWRALAPGGRLVIRDGVLPPLATWELALLAEDAPSFFQMFAEQFAGRQIRYTRLAPDRVRLSSWDATEFVLKYTWGPDSFPYEIREQYAVRPYAEYVEAMVRALEPRPAVVALPPGLQSYLQEGYARGLAGKVALFDEAGAPIPLPDSNAVFVLEKQA